MNKIGNILEGLIEKRMVVEMTAREVIDTIGKNNIQIVTQNGVEGFKLINLDTKKTNFVKKYTDEIRAKKDEIIALIKQEQEEKEKKKAEDARKKKEEDDNLINSGKAFPVIAFYGHYLMKCEISYVKQLTSDEELKYNKDYHGRLFGFVREIKEILDSKWAREVADSMKLDFIGYYTNGESQLFRLTEAQSKKIVKDSEEREKAVADAKKASEEMKTQKAEKEKQDALEKAKQTGNPVSFKSWSEPCNDPKEECNVDIVSLVAMPGGTIKTQRKHTW